MRKLAAHYIFPISGKPIKNGYIELTDSGVITEIGELENESESTEFYNGILVPGFINAHSHIELSHLQGKFTRGSGMAGFIRQINELRESTQKEERIRRVEQEMDNLYNQGVSAMADISNCDESFAAKSSSKLYTRTYLEVFGTEKKDVKEVIDNVLKLSETAANYGIDAAPTPHSCYTMSPELLRESAYWGLKSGFISYHNQESFEEEELIISGTGALAQEYKGRGLSTPPVTGKPALDYFIDQLRMLGREKFEENILLVHNIATNQASIDKANAHLSNATWVICPLSNLFIHNTLPPLRLFMEKNLRIAIGTDSLSSNAELSIISEIMTIMENFREIKFEEILKWATINGAKALNRDVDFGSFEVGKTPGVVHIDNIEWETLSPTRESRSKRVI